MKNKHKINNHFIFILTLIALFIVVMGIGGVVAAECGATPTLGCGATVSTTFDGGTYSLNSTNANAAFYVNAPNITIDCNGSTFIGNMSLGSQGASILKDNTTLKNCNFRSYYSNVIIQNRNNITIDNVSSRYGASSGAYGGIYITNSSNIVANNSRIQDLANGVYCNLATGGCVNLTIANSWFSNITNGIRLNRANTTAIIGNNFSSTTKVFLEQEAYFTTISSNWFSQSTNGVSSNGYGTTESDVNILNNIIYNVSIFFPANNVTNIVMRGNKANLLNTFLDSAGVTENVSIADNTFEDYKNDVTAYTILFRSSTLTLNRQNLTIVNNTFTDGAQRSVFFQGSFVSGTVANNSFYHNYVDSTRSGHFIELKNTSGVFDIVGNAFNDTSNPIRVWSYSSAAVNIHDNIFDQAIRNGDSYNGHISVNHGSNIVINNNTFLRSGCFSVLVQGGDNITITNNTASFLFQDNINANTSCGYEAPTFLFLNGIWKTWTTDATENLTGDNITKIATYAPTNIRILGNNASGFPVILNYQDTTSLTHDLTGYWYVSFATPNYLFSRQHWFISNSVNNISTTFNETRNYPVVIRTLLGNGYGSSTDGIKMQFQIFKSYLWFQNVNLTQNYTTALYNQTSALFSNGTALCNGSSPNIASNTGNVNITLRPGEACWVLDNANVTEGVSRENMPIWISSVTSASNSKTYHFASNLSDTINNLSFYPNNVPCPSSIEYTSTSSTYKYNSEFSCVNGILNNVTLNGIEQAANSNELTLHYTTSSGGGGYYTPYNLPSKDEINTYLCQKTLNYINTHNQNDYLHLDNIVEIIQIEKGYTESKTKLQDYLINWQAFCSDAINRTLEEKSVCNKVYYFLAEKGNNYTIEDFKNLKNSVDTQIISLSSAVLKDYLVNYNSKCYLIIGKKLNIQTNNSVSLPMVISQAKNLPPHLIGAIAVIVFILAIIIISIFSRKK